MRVLETTTVGRGTMRRYLKQAATGLAYCHSHNVFHLDVKPDNLLVKGSHLSVADFGFASTARYTTVVGTSTYAAPEVGALQEACKAHFA